MTFITSQQVPSLRDWPFLWFMEGTHLNASKLSGFQILNYDYLMWIQILDHKNQNPLASSNSDSVLFEVEQLCPSPELANLLRGFCWSVKATAEGFYIMQLRLGLRCCISSLNGWAASIFWVSISFNLVMKFICSLAYIDGYKSYFVQLLDIGAYYIY